MIHAIDLKFQGFDEAIASFLVETENGPVLFETGPHSTFPSMEAGLKDYGYRPSDVKHVFITHIHLDHAGAAWAFAELGAKIYMHPFGVNHMVDPSKLMDSAKRIYQDQMDRLWGQMKAIPPEHIVSVDHQQEIEVGSLKVRALHTPGHAKHHVAWELGSDIIAGDLAGVKIGAGPVVPPCPPPDIDIEKWLASIDLVLELAPKRLLLTHYGYIENIKEHMSALKAILNDWATWIKEKSETGLSAEEMTPLFSEYTAEQLLSQGVSDYGTKQYEAANPSWMSVAGLLRYWKKKEANQL